MIKKKSMVLLSGGLDSAANLAFCRQQDLPISALTFNYGQRAANAEIRAAADLCRYFEIPHETLDLSFLFKHLGQSALTRVENPIPHLAKTQLDDPTYTRKSAAAVWVPNRNGVFLALAAAMAEARGIEQVIVGFNREEAATFPDNTSEFAEQFTRSLAFSTRNQVRVQCYTFSLSKLEIVKRLRREVSSFPFEKIWSCYEGGDRPCERCESCQRLARALENSL